MALKVWSGQKWASISIDEAVAALPDSPRASGTNASKCRVVRRYTVSATDGF